MLYVCVSVRYKKILEHIPCLFFFCIKNLFNFFKHQNIKSQLRLLKYQKKVTSKVNARFTFSVTIWLVSFSITVEFIIDYHLELFQYFKVLQNIHLLNILWPNL